MKTVALLFVVLALAACGRPPMTAEEAMPALRSADADARRQAADDLRSDETNGVRPVAVPLLLNALASEPDPAVTASLLLTLGRSGAPEAKGPIEDALADASDARVRRAAKKALAYWKAQNDEGSPGASAYWIPGWHPATKVGSD